MPRQQIKESAPPEDIAPEEWIDPEDLTFATPPDLNQDARQRRLINKAYDLAEQRIDRGEATAQEIVYFLKLGSQREQKEMLILESQAKLYNAKTEALASAKHTEELYNKAIEAMRSYSGLVDASDDPNLY